MSHYVITPNYAQYEGIKKRRNRRNKREERERVPVHENKTTIINNPQGRNPKTNADF
jgi:hypothetical protein